MSQPEKSLSRPAYSLAFAIAYMTIILIIASSTMENVQEKLVYYKEMQAPVQARLYAEGAADLAKAYVGLNGLGWEDATTACTPDADEETDADELRCGRYEVLALGKANPNGGSGFYIPIPHTGSAAPEGTCSVQDFLDGQAQPPDHACNWNRIRFGQSVSIPLFTENEDGSTSNPVDLGFNTLSLTFRTPCTPDPATGAARLECADGERYELDEGNGISIDQNNSLVLWQVYGQLNDGTEVSKLVDDQIFSDDDGIEQRDPLRNTEITESRVNDGASIVSAVGGARPFAAIADFLNNPDLEFAFLQMDVIYPLIQESGEPIPYLEWQFSSDVAFPDTKAVLLGRGYYEALTGIFAAFAEIQVPVTGEGSTLYTVSN